MKKTYISPLASEVSVMTESMIAASVRTFNTQVDTKSTGVQLGNKQQSQWGDLWNK